MTWHFASDRLRDGRPLPPDGETLIHTGPLVMCESGLHASERLIDALQYAPGPIICRVECDGTIKREKDKLICTQRTIQWRIDGTNVLRAFARKCALDVAHLWEMPAIVLQYLETGDEAHRAAAWAAAGDAAKAAAGDAAKAAAKDAAWAAAWAAARGAAKGAAWAAVWAAAGDAAGAAAGDAAKAAAVDAQNITLEAMADACHTAVTKL